MSESQYVEQLEILEDTMTFALDHHASEVSKIPEEVFFKTIYVERKDDENKIARTILNTKHLAILAAPKGAGKTTILRKVVNEIFPNKVYYYFADFKKLYANLYPEKVLDMYLLSRIQKVLKEDISKYYFFNSHDLKILFICKTLQYFFVSRYDQLMFKYQASTGIEKMSDKQFLDNFKKDFNSIAEENKYIEDNISVANLIRALMLTLGINNYCLILDNIDRLPMDLQAYILGIAVDIDRGGEGYFQTLVAVRKKNIMRYQEEGMGNDVINIKSLNNETGVTAKVYDIGNTFDSEDESFNINQINNFIRNILLQRHIFAEQVDKINGTCNKEFWEIFNNLRERVNNRFVEERLLNLSNHSITQTLSMNLEFTKYIYSLIDTGDIKVNKGAPDLSDSELMSHLYRWFTTSSDKNHDLLSDTVKNYERFNPKNPLESLDCDLDHVILAWLVNNKYHRNRIRDIITAFQSIGASETSLNDKLFKLYDREPERRYIEIGNAELRITADSVIKDKDLRVMITPLGQEFIKNVLTKFEYLYESLNSLTTASETSSGESKKQIAVSYRQKVEKVKSHLFRMVVVHTVALKFIRDNVTKPEINWERYYRDNFCIKGELIVERIMISHLRHLIKADSTNYQDYRNEYIDILKKYLEGINSTNSAEVVLSIKILS